MVVGNTNTVPVAAFSVSTLSETTPLEVALGASESLDADGDLANIRLGLWKRRNGYYAEPNNYF